jgi:c-di-GMP-binding flagellar brake protein YcgR
MADRREQTRFELTGQLWASVDFRAPIVIRDLATGGALVETTLAPNWSTLRLAQMSLSSQGPTVTVVVRHITPVHGSPEEGRHLIGLEFVNVSPSVQADIDRLVTAASEPPLP